MNGKAFYVISHYPREYGNGFSPRADVILKNLKALKSNDRPQSGLTGFGALRIGMTVREASNAIAEPLISLGQSTGSCSYVSPRQKYPGLNLMVIDDRIARIDVRNVILVNGQTTRIDSSITTLSGAKIGDSEAKIKQLYPERLRVSQHPYVREGHYLTFVPNDAKDQNYRLIFETDGKQVTSFRSGRLSEVEWIEGCS